MLIQFTVSNFLSFDEETTFSMVADSDDQQHPDHVLNDNVGSPLLRAAALYGANAAGKSNLIKAIAFAQRRILGGSHGDQAIPVQPFRLRAGSADRPSGFEFLFKYNARVYSYGFRPDATRVVEEWLFSKTRGVEVKLFERTTDENGKTTVEFGRSLQGGGAKQKQFLEFVAQGTRQNQLFLTEAFDRNVEAVKPVVEWFQRVLLVIHADAPARHIEMYSHEDAELNKFVSKFLNGRFGAIPFLGDSSRLMEDRAEATASELDD